MSRSKYSNAYKSVVIEEGKLKAFNELKKAYYKESDISIDSDGVIEHVNYWQTDCAIMRHDDKQFDCAYLLAKSKIAKAKKVKEKIGEIVMNYNAVFITLTFTDDVINNTTMQTRRRYVARYLKAVSPKYVANIDFSPDIGREHYHAVVITRVDLKAWKYGFAHAEQIRAHDRDLCRISKYITKLTAHALKIDFTRLIYSR